MDIRGKQPSNGAQDGVSRGSLGSVQWDQLERRPSGESTATGTWSRLPGELRRRRSSVSQQLGALGQAGGVNSINNFARSWQRAAGFFEITPVRPSFRIESEAASDDEDFAEEQPRVRASLSDHRSALRRALQDGGRRPSDNAVADEEAHEETRLLPGAAEERLRSRRSESIFNIEPSLSSAFGGSYGTGYGSLSARVNDSSMRHAGRLFTEQQMKGVTEPECEREPLLVKQIEEDGHIINVVVGQSTLPQTIFNSVNVLVGVGLLTLPLAFRYSGWVIGLIFLVFSAVSTTLHSSNTLSYDDLDYLKYLLLQSYGYETTTPNTDTTYTFYNKQAPRRSRLTRIGLYIVHCQAVSKVLGRRHLPYHLRRSCLCLLWQQSSNCSQFALLFGAASCLCCAGSFVCGQHGRSDSRMGHTDMEDGLWCHSSSTELSPTALLVLHFHSRCYVMLRYHNSRLARWPYQA